MVLLVKQLLRDNMNTIKIVYHDNHVKPLDFLPNGDWIDLRTSQSYDLKTGDFVLLDLGISMKLPEGYEAHIVPRSSTFKNFGLIQTNGIGIIDNSYSGTNDIWKMPVYATRDIHIDANVRICQFRLFPKMQSVKFQAVTELDKNDRGGFGSTGL